MKNPMTIQGWFRKFRLASNGLLWAVRNEGSFRVHLPAAIAVVVIGLLLQLDLIRWALLALCIGLVIALELINTAIEALARAIDANPNDELKTALDVSSGAVWFGSLVSALTGLLVLLSVA